MRGPRFPASCCTLLLLAAAWSASGQEPRTVFHVRYVASGAVYLDGGRSAGLAEGFHLTVKRRAPGEAELEAKPVAEVVVISLADNSAACEVKSHEGELEVGDVAYLSSQDTETARMVYASKSTRKYAQIVSFTEGDPLEEELRAYVPKPPLPEINRIRGRVAFEQSTIQDHGASQASSVQEGMSVRADMTRLGGSYWNFTGYWHGRLTSSGSAGQPTLTDLLNRTYHIGLYYDNPNSHYVAGIGRLLLPWASSLNTIDGAYFARRFGRHITTGIFAGSTPDPTSWNYNKDRQIGGAFTNLEAGSFDGVRYSGTAGLALTRLKWRAERQFSFFENSIFFKQYFSIYHDLEADQLVRGRLGGTESGPVVSRSFLTVRFQPHRVIAFDFNDNYFRNVPTFDLTLLGTGLLQKFLFQGLSAGVRLNLPYRMSVYTSQGRSRRDSDVRPSWNQMYGVMLGHLGAGLRADLAYSKFDSSFGKGHYTSATLIREFGERLRMSMQAGQQDVRSTFSTQGRGNFLTYDLDWFFATHYFLSGGATTYRGNIQNYDQILFSLGYRF